jgi:hypothetical protein
MMKATLGSQWKNYFDLCVCNARTPLFQRADSPFYRYNKQAELYKGRKISNAKELFQHSAEKIFLYGNANQLTEYFKYTLCKDDPKVLYFGANFFDDVQATVDFNQRLRYAKSKATWDAVAIVPEFDQLEQIEGTVWRPLPLDESMWGASWFFDNFPIPTVTKNYFLDDISKKARYAVGSMGQLGLLL